MHYLVGIALIVVSLVSSTTQASSVKGGIDGASGAQAKLSAECEADRPVDCGDFCCPSGYR